MSTSKNNRKPQASKRPPITLDRTPRPRVLVLESYHGAASRAVARSGGIPVEANPRSVEETCRALEAGMFDALLLTGGGDIEPRRYGARPHKEVYGTSETRDELELLALDVAADLGIPVMGICRGAQMIAVHNGGKLRQHIRGHRGGTHLVITEPGSNARSATGYIKLTCVSLHHQEIVDPGPGFVRTGKAIDGTTEIIESKDERCIGFQYHPEMDYGVNEASRHAFDWLVDKACEKLDIAFPEKPYRPPMPVPMPRAWEQSSKRAAKSAKHRQAGTQTRPSIPVAPRPKAKQAKFDSSVAVSWLCPHCALRFDDHDDREMHVVMIHGLPTTGNSKEWQARSEPPEGHSDWDDVRRGAAPVA